MHFLKEWDIEKVASKVASGIEEFPSERAPAHAGPRGGRAPSSHQASSAFKAWDDLDFEGKKQEWAELCDHLKALQNSRSNSWEERAKDAEYQLLRMCNMLLLLPDPLPFLSSTATLSAKLAEAEARNKELQAAADAAAADTTEVATLVEQHRALTAAHEKLQDSLAANEAELVQSRAAAAEAARVRAEAEAQSAEVHRLQEALRVLKLENERAQSSLFEVTNAQDQEAGGRQREMELAAEELERVQQRAAELALERDTLAQRLEATTEELEAALAAVEEGGGGGGGVGVEGGHSGEDNAGTRTQDGGEASNGSSGVAERVRGSVRRGGRRKGESSDGGDAEGFWERQVRVRGEQIAALQAQLTQQQQAAAEAAAQLEMQAQSWSNRLAAAELSISKLEAELTKRPEPHVYQELIAQVTALQQLVDVQMESEGWGQESIRSAIATLGLTPSATSATVSSIQQERNRKLASDVSSLKRQLEDKSTALAAAQRDASAMEAKANSAIALADRLEGDLAAVQHGHTAHLPALRSSSHKLSTGESLHHPDASTGQDEPDSAAQHALRESVAQMHASPLSRMGPGQSDNGAATVQGPATPDAHDPGSASSLLDIVISQRDRFRQRMGQLDEEKGALSEQLAKAQKQLDTCRADNIALYEKVRFIEQYSQKSSGGPGPGRNNGAKVHVLRVDNAGVPLESEAAAEQRAGARYQCGPLAFEIGGSGEGDGGGADAAKGGGQGALSGAGVRARGQRKMQAFCFPSDETQYEETGGPEARYARAYEAKVNPFTEFQQKEMEARVRSLQLHDRAMLAGSKLLVGNRFARAFVAAYAVLLHLFIMALLYYAMVPASNNRVVEMVDMGAVQQQQEAAGEKGTVGRLLLSGMFNQLQAHWHTARSHRELRLPGHD